MRVCRVIATGRILEGQSHAKDGTLISNAKSGGHLENEIEELDMTDEAFEDAIKIQDANDFMAVATYREKRGLRYISEMSPEADFKSTLGDCVDALIDAHYGDATKLNALKATRDLIKSQIPKA